MEYYDHNVEIEPKFKFTGKVKFYDGYVVLLKATDKQMKWFSDHTAFEYVLISDYGGYTTTHERDKRRHVIVSYSQNEIKIPIDPALDLVY